MQQHDLILWRVLRVVAYDRSISEGQEIMQWPDNQVLTAGI